MKPSTQHTELYSIWHRTHRQLGVSFDDFVENLPKYLSVSPGFFLSGNDVKYQDVIGERDIDKFAKDEYFNHFRKVVTSNTFRLFQNLGVFSNDGARAITHNDYSLTHTEEGKQIRGIPYKFDKTYTLERIGHRLLRRQSSENAVSPYTLSPQGLTFLDGETISFNDIFALAITNAYGEKIIRRREEILKGKEETRQQDLESYFNSHQGANTEVPVKLLAWGCVNNKVKQVSAYLLISKFLKEANDGQSSGNGVVNLECISEVRSKLRLKPSQWESLKNQMVTSGLLRYISGKLHKVGQEEVAGVGGVIDRDDFLPTYREIIGGKGRECLSYFNEWRSHMDSDLLEKPKVLADFILDNLIRFIAARAAHARSQRGWTGANLPVERIAKLLHKSPTTITRAKRRCFSVTKNGYRKLDTLRAYEDHTFVSEPRGGEKNENKLLRSIGEVYTEFGYISQSSVNFNLDNNFNRQGVKNKFINSSKSNCIDGDVITVDTLEHSSTVDTSIPQPSASLIDLSTFGLVEVARVSFSTYPLSTIDEGVQFATRFSRRDLPKS